MKTIKLYEEFHSKINECISDSIYDSLFNKVKEISNKLNVGKNYTEVEIKQGEDYDDRHIMVKYVQPNWEYLYSNSTSDEEIQKLVDENTKHIENTFKPLEDYFQKGISGLKDTFSRGLKTVDVSVSGYITKVQAESNPDDFHGKRYKGVEFNIVRYSSVSKKNILGTEEEYISKYGKGRLNNFEVYVYINPRLVK